MLSSRVAKAIAAAAVLTIGCDAKPYDSLKDETVGLGSVDPVNFPPDNLGADGNRMQPGSGSFTASKAFAGGEEIGYFAYPVNTPAPRDPLRVLDSGMPYPGVSTPVAYVFDATDTQPVADKNHCTPPAGYDPKDPANLRNEPPECTSPGTASCTQHFYQQQGNIFTDLPKASYTPGVAAATAYVPVVLEARIKSSSDRTCQEIKSQKYLSDQFGGKPPKAGTNYLAWLIIDPAAAVYDKDGMPENGLGLQKWGWYNRYLTAYLDGGYIPTTDVMVSNADMTMMKTVKRMVTQKLYVPLQVVDPDSMMPVDVQPGMGFDVLEAKRGNDGYSPVCEVLTYDTKTPMLPDALPKDAMTIEAMFGPTMPASPHYMYCLQVEGPAQ